MNEDNNSNKPPIRWRFEEPGVIHNGSYYCFSEYRLSGEFSITDDELQKSLNEMDILVSQVEDLFLKPLSETHNDTLRTMDCKAFIYRLRDLGAYEDHLIKYFESYMPIDVELIERSIEQKKKQ